MADTEAALREYAEIEGKAEDEIDRNDKLVQEMLTHGKHPNLSFFAFTATPKPATLEMFGSQWTDGSFHPFHIYSMRQAIEEGFILDVLQNYMTYSTCFKIAKDTPENPELPESRAKKKVRQSFESTNNSEIFNVSSGGNPILCLQKRILSPSCLPAFGKVNFRSLYRLISHCERDFFLREREGFALFLIRRYYHIFRPMSIM